MRMARLHHSLARWALGGLCLAALCSGAGAAGEPDYSPAERLVFMDDHLHRVKPPATLHYGFRKSGSLEEGFTDGVSVRLSAQPDGSCCAGRGEFLSGTHQFNVAEVENAHANPVILYFLERDIAEMHRLAKGQQNYFRKRIRMAIYDGAAVRDLNLRYRGQDVSAHEVAISPYLDDPMKPRYEKFARKRYTFWLSDAVPGGVYGIRTVMSDERVDAPPLMTEELFVDGAEPPPARSTP